MSYTKFLKRSWVTMKVFFFGCLVIDCLFPPCAIILENKSDALGINSSIPTVNLAIRRSSKNIDP